ESHGVKAETAQRSDSSSRGKWSVGIGVVVAAVLLLGLAGYRLFRPGQAKVAFEHYRITRLTSTGNVIDAGLSSDGRYLAYITTEHEGHSLWVQQIASSSNVRVLGPLPFDLDVYHPRFSPDGTYIFFCQYDSKRETADLFRLPAVGGTPAK